MPVSDAVRVAMVLDVPLDDLVFDSILASTPRFRSSRLADVSGLRGLGRRIAAARYTARLTPMAIYARTAITPRRLSAIEHGQEPSLGELGRLAVAVGTGVKELIGLMAETSVDDHVVP